jgi:hypothetical protein
LFKGVSVSRCLPALAACWAAATVRTEKLTATKKGMHEEKGTCPRKKKLGGRDLCFLLHRNKVYASKNEEEKEKEEKKEK